MISNVIKTYQWDCILILLNNIIGLGGNLNRLQISRFEIKRYSAYVLFKLLVRIPKSSS